jgi:hypothetical protein
MTAPEGPQHVHVLIDRLARGDRSTALALRALITAADDSGSATMDQVAVVYRQDHLAAQRAAGRDAEREAGELSMDQVRAHLANSVLPRLASEGIVELPSQGLLDATARVRMSPRWWSEVKDARAEVEEALRQTGEHAAARETRTATESVPPARTAACWKRLAYRKCIAAAGW